MYNTKLTILPRLDLVDSAEKSITIKVKKSTHKFSRNALASGNGNVNIFGSESYNTINGQNYNFINMEYTLPIIRIKSDCSYNMNIVNNTEYYFNFHWHGLTVYPEEDGALLVLAFGPGTPSMNFRITGTLVNNSAITLNHTHNMDMASTFLYSGLLNFINIEDDISAPVDNLFNYNEANSNFIQMVYQDIDLNNDGTLNQDKLYDFSWRANYGAINGTSCINWLDNNNKFVDTLYYESNKNVVKVTLLNASCSYRNIYLGVCDNNNNIQNFYLVQTDQGYRNPTLVNICSFSIANRNSIMFDLNDFPNNEAYLFLYNYDLTNNPIKNNGIKPFLKIYNKIPQIIPYNVYLPVNNQLKRYLKGKCPNSNVINASQCFYSGNSSKNFNMNLQNIIRQIRTIVFGNKPLVIDYAEQHPNFELDVNINYLTLLNRNYFHKLPNLINTPPTRKIIGWYDTLNSKDNGSTDYITDGQNRYMIDIFNSDEKALYEENPTSILPTCLFKIIDNPNNYVSYEMITNNKLIVILYNSIYKVKLQTIQITFDKNTDKLPYNINEWVDIVNTKFHSTSVNISSKPSYSKLSDILTYSYEIVEYAVPYFESSSSEIIHTIKIKNTNKTSDLIIELVGPLTLLNFFGKPFMGMPMSTHSKFSSNNKSFKKINNKTNINSCYSSKQMKKNVESCCSSKKVEKNVESCCSSKKVEKNVESCCSSKQIIEKCDTCDCVNGGICNCGDNCNCGDGCCCHEDHMDNNSSLKQSMAMSGDASGNTQYADSSGNFTLKIEPNTIYYGFTDGYMNENYSNFTVLKGSTEELYYCNLDTAITHPLHFHLSAFYFNPQNLNNSPDVPYNNQPNKNTVYNDYNQNLYSKDVVIVPPQQKLNYYIKYVYSSDNEPYLGYMFHCHLMAHHDMAMMGQFYVLNENNFNTKFIHTLINK